MPKMTNHNSVAPAAPQESSTVSDHQDADDMVPVPAICVLLMLAIELAILLTLV